MKTTLELKNKFDFIISLVLCLCTSISLFMTFPFPESLVSDSAVLTLIENLYLSTRANALYICIFFFILIFLRKQAKPQERNVLLSFICLVLAVIWLMGKSFEIDNTLDTLSTGAGQILKSLIYIAGSYNLLMLLGNWALSFMHSSWDIKDCKAFHFVKKHSFISFFSAILICTIPTWLVCYPGYMCSDSYCQLAYYFGIYEFVSHHPPVHTLLISWPVKLGILLGSSNLGLYLVVSCQILVFSAVFAYMLHTMMQFSAPRWLMLISFFTIILGPIYVPVAAKVIKDNVYSYGVVLFTVELAQLFRLRKQYWKKLWHIALLFCSILMIMLLRNNGKYLLYVFIPVLLVLFGYHGKKLGTLKSSAFGSVMLVLPLVVSILIQNFVMLHYDVSPGSRREALSLPFQQTARYVLERGDEISSEEREAIDGVIDINEIGVFYSPMISDPVKQWFRDECGTDDLIAYFKVWIKHGIRAPHVYLKATVNQNYPLFCPWVTQSYWHGQTESSIHPHISEPLGLHDVQFGDRVKEIMNVSNDILSLLPVPGFSSNLPCCCLLMIFLSLGAIKRKNWRFLVFALPSLITIGTVILAPLVDIRYAFSVIYSMPIVLTLYLTLNKTCKE